MSKSVLDVAHAYDPHLRSCKAVAGDRILAIDGEIGHVAERPRSGVRTLWE